MKTVDNHRLRFSSNFLYENLKNFRTALFCNVCNRIKNSQNMSYEKFQGVKTTKEIIKKMDSGIVTILRDYSEKNNSLILTAFFSQTFF